MLKEIAFDFGKRTSCAADHVVIKFSDIWETIASCFQFRLMNHWTEGTESVWKTQLVTVVKKMNGKLTMRGFRPSAILPTIYPLYSKTLQQLAGGALQSRHGPQYGHVLGRQAHEVVWMLRRVVEQATEWQTPVFEMDCDVAAAFDHVSHHELAVGVAPTLIDAWIREHRNSETIAKLDIVTPGTRRTRSVPQCDPCARRTFLEQPWTHQPQSFAMGCPWEAVIWVCCFSRTLAGSSRCRQESSKLW